MVFNEQTQQFIVGDQDVDFGSAHKSVFDLAVSKTANPTTLGTSDWNFYQINTTENGGTEATTYDADYPGNFGWNNDAFVFTLNMFPVLAGGNYHVQVNSVSMSDLAAGVSQANLHAYQNDVNNAFSLRPTVMHDSKSGDPMWLIDTYDSSHIQVFKMTNVLSNSATISPNTVTVNSYSNVVFPVQPNGSDITTNIDFRIQKCAENNNTLVACQAIAASSTEDDIRWYKIDVSSGSPVLLDQGNVSAGDNTYLVYPSIDINSGGDIGMTYMRSGNDTTTDFMSMWVTGRATYDPAGTMQTPVLVKAGAKNYSDFASPHRAGDLSGINVDSDGSFFAVNEYATTRSSSNWGTEVSRFVVAGTITVSQVNAPPSPTEGVNTGTFTLAVFTDSDGAMTAGDFTVTVNWGDGVTSVYTGGTNVTSDGLGQFEVTGRRTYPEEMGGLSLSVQIGDANGVTAGGTSSTFTVAEAMLGGLSISSPGAIEGVGTGSVRVASFHDTNANASPADFTAVIDWGDGSTTTVTGAGIVALPNSNFLVRSSHTYGEDGTYTLSVQILDDGGASLSGSQTIPVADAPLSSLSLKSPGAIEGIATNTVTIATFHDANTAAPVNDFTAVIAWGDGSTTTVLGSSGNIVAKGSGNFAVLSSHTYAEDGSVTLGVQVIDVGGASVLASRLIAVADAPLTKLAVQNPGATEGTSTGAVTVATFHDANTAAPVTDFTATVTWGDGGSSAGSIVSLGGGDFAVLASHTYAEEGPVTLSVQVFDVGGANASASSRIAVKDAPLVNLTLQNPGATEGTNTGAVTVATFHDTNTAAPATDFTATVTWGDGSSSAASISSLGGGDFAVLAGHTYADEGTYTLAVKVLDVGGSNVSGNLTISVADAPLGGLAVQDPGATEGINTGTVTVATFSDTNPGAPAADFKAAIHWGDGTTTTVSGGSIASLGSGNFAVLASHTYAEDGTLTLSVDILDKGGASVSGALTIAVADGPLSNLSISSPGATEGVATGSVRVASFHDANASAPVADFTAVIAWGDGSTTTVLGSSGNIVALGKGDFLVRSGHTYGEDGTSTLSVQILDKGGASISGSQTIPVADAPLSNLSLKPLGTTEGIGAATYTVATFHDKNVAAPTTDFTAVVQWGDGTTTTVTGGGIVSLGSGNFAVVAGHTYAEEGPVTLSVQVLDTGSASISGSRSITVADAPLTSLAVQNLHPAAGTGTGTVTVATFHDKNVAAPTGDFTAVIQWGDGTTTTVTGSGLQSLGSGDFAVLSSHIYPTSGAVTLSVSISDFGGASVSGFRKITVT